MPSRWVCAASVAESGGQRWGRGSLRRRVSGEIAVFTSSRTAPTRPCHELCAPKIRTLRNESDDMMPRADTIHSGLEPRHEMRVQV